MASVTRENIGLLNDKLTVQLSKEDYYTGFEQNLKKYAKTANIPGFRKGMVPAGLVKKMYGQGVFSDEILRKVETELNTYLNNEKLEIFAQPLPLDNDAAKLDMNNPVDYSFAIEIGLKPVFDIDPKNIKVTRYNVTVTDTMVQEEVERLQIRNGKMTEPETIDNEDNVINLLFKESDKDGNETEAGIAKENSVILKYFTPAVQKQLKGKKVGDSITVQLSKAFDADKMPMMQEDLGLDATDAEAIKKYFKLEIVKIGLVEKRELEEGFFKEIYPGKDITTEEELRKAIKEEIQQYWDGQSHNQLQDQLYHYLIDETKMEFPGEFLKRWLQTGGEKAKTAEEAEKEYPSFSNQLKWTLISDKLTKENKLEVSNE